MQPVFLLLQTEFVARRAGRAFAAAETAALVKNHRLDGGKQLRGGHQADGDAGAAEDGFDDVAVRIIRDDDAVLDRVPADDAAGRHLEIEDGIVRRGKLVDEFLRRRAAVPNAGVAFLEDDHATALDAFVVRIHGGGDDVGETHVGDEAPALVHLQHRLLAVLPLGHANLAGEHSGLNPGERDRFGQRKGGADLLAFLARLERRGAANVFGALLRRSALVNRRQTQIAGEAARGGAGIHPRKFERHQRQRHVLRPGDEAAVLRVQGRGGDAAFIEVLEQSRFCGRPLVRVASAVRDDTGDRPARDGAARLHEHVEFVAVGETPHDLADVVAGEGLQSRRGFCSSDHFHKNSFIFGRFFLSSKFSPNFVHPNGQ